ncbi:hypothetical protein C8J56DRAFT_1048666 [Mycena floridula]|nr:hypothetical protein C8J56DRAFT_1048666 [Mycena floridula]
MSTSDPFLDPLFEVSELLVTTKKTERPGVSWGSWSRDREAEGRAQEGNPTAGYRQAVWFIFTFVFTFFSSFLSVIRSLCCNVEAGRSILLVANFREPYLP